MKNSIRHTLQISLLVVAAVASAVSCGRAPSRLLRQGQLPIYDFPLYLSDGGGGNGKIWSIDRGNGVVAPTPVDIFEGLNDPQGVATDRYGHLFVVDKGTNRLLKLKVEGLDLEATDLPIDVNSPIAKYADRIEVVASGLNTPSVVAVDSIGEVFVTEDGTGHVVRAKDKEVVISNLLNPLGLAFGVADLFLVGDMSTDTVFWGKGTGPQATVSDPSNITTDGNGRVYISEGILSGARVLRYNQDGPDSLKVVAQNLRGPSGIAVDPVGNIYVVEKFASLGPRLVLVNRQGVANEWLKDPINVPDPQYVAFTQY